MSDETSRQMRQTLSPLRSAGTVAAIGAFLSFTNPFGATAALPFWAAFLYWTMLVGIGWFGGSLIGFGIARMAPAIDPRINRAIATLIVAVLVTGAILLVQEMLRQPVPRSYWPTLYVLVLGISVGVAAVAWMAERAFAGGPGAVTRAAPAGSVETRARFLERLPPKLKGAVIYAVSAEDHYLRLHTSKGADLILIRLSDAITELEGLEGAQTHRSWWVARDAVESSRRDGDKLLLVLKGGVEAPVSRPNVRTLREAGWL